MSERPTQFEIDVLTALLGSVESAVRDQVAQCRVIKREFTGVGLFSDLVVVQHPPAPSATWDWKWVTGDVYLDHPDLNHGAGAMVLVKDGLLCLLECFTYSDPWPDDMESWSIVLGQDVPRDRG